MSLPALEREKSAQLSPYTCGCPPKLYASSSSSSITRINFTNKKSRQSMLHYKQALRKYGRGKEEKAATGSWVSSDKDKEKYAFEKRKKIVIAHGRQQERLAAQAKAKQDVDQERKERCQRKTELRRKYLDKIAAKKREDYEKHCSRIKAWQAPGERNVNRVRARRLQTEVRKKAARVEELEQRRTAVEQALQAGFGNGPHDDIDDPEKFDPELVANVKKWTREFRIVDHTGQGGLDARQLMKLFKRLGRMVREAEAVELIATWDLQGQNRIDLREFISHMKMEFLKDREKDPEFQFKTSENKNMKLSGMDGVVSALVNTTAAASLIGKMHGDLSTKLIGMKQSKWLSQHSMGTQKRMQEETKRQAKERKQMRAEEAFSRAAWRKAAWDRRKEELARQRAERRQEAAEQEQMREEEWASHDLRNEDWKQELLLREREKGRVAAREATRAHADRAAAETLARKLSEKDRRVRLAWLREKRRVEARAVWAAEHDAWRRQTMTSAHKLEWTQQKVEATRHAALMAVTAAMDVRRKASLAQTAVKQVREEQQREEERRQRAHKLALLQLSTVQRRARERDEREAMREEELAARRLNFQRERERQHAHTMAVLARRMAQRAATVSAEFAELAETAHAELAAAVRLAWEKAEEERQAAAREKEHQDIELKKYRSREERRRRRAREEELLKQATEQEQRRREVWHQQQVATLQRTRGKAFQLHRMRMEKQWMASLEDALWRPEEQEERERALMRTEDVNCGDVQRTRRDAQVAWAFQAAPAEGQNQEQDQDHVRKNGGRSEEGNVGSPSDGKAGKKESSSILEMLEDALVEAEGEGGEKQVGLAGRLRVMMVAKNQFIRRTSKVDELNDDVMRIKLERARARNQAAQVRKRSFTGLRRQSKRAQRRRSSQLQHAEGNIRE